MKSFRLFVGIFAMIGVLGLAACKEDKKADAQAKDAEHSEQINIAKYNGYVSAANAMQKSFGNGLEGYEKYIVPALASKKPLDSFWTVENTSIAFVKKKLDAAIALPGSVTEIDLAARDYVEALNKLAPLSQELDDYARSKGYLSDGGAKAREKGADYHAAVRAAAQAQDAFDAAIERQDVLNIRTAFEKEQPGTRKYYEAGILYHGKQSMQAAQAFFATPDNAATAAAFKSSIEQVAAMVEGRTGKLREANITSCTQISSSANDYLASARTALSNAEKGRYKEKPSSIPVVAGSRTIDGDARNVSQNFSALIAAFNQGRC